MTRWIIFSIVATIAILVGLIFESDAKAVVFQILGAAQALAFHWWIAEDKP